ncbi:MAG: hypothetical protein WEB78_02010 [Ilumatobacteraceae bacterium]
MTSADVNARHRIGRGAALSLGAAVVGVIWWQWPALAGHRDRTDVVVIADDFLVPGIGALEAGIRTTGRAVEVTSPRGWCDPAVVSGVPGVVDANGAVVLAYGGDEPCELLATIESLDDSVETVVVVRQPGATWPDGIDVSGAVLVEPERLVGSGEASTVLVCEWWDAVWLQPCGVDGAAPVTDASGALTEFGYDRLARMVAGALGG